MAERKRHEGGKKISPSTSLYLLTGIFIAIAAILYYFWAVPYKAALSYREQLQLFQTTGSYFQNLMGQPAGIATYLGTFLTQFFNNYWIGAAVMSGLLTIFLLLCYLINRKFSPSLSQYTNLSLSCIPLISLLLFLGNPDVTLNFILALVFVITTAYLLICINNSDINATKGAIREYGLTVVLTSLLYWLCGPVTIIFTILAVIDSCRKSYHSVTYKAIFAVIALIWLAVNIFVWSSELPYPLSYQLIGIGYVMMPDRLYAGQVVVEAMCVIIPIVAMFIARLPKKIMIPTLTGVEIAALIILYPKSFDSTTYSLIDYDYMVRANDWEGILKYSDENEPNLPLSVSATNLAAGMTGNLDAVAFNYLQHGVEGLIPPFVKETLSSWTTGEIFFQLGMINSAQRFYFEGMEAIPNYNKSSRAVKRIAETAIIRGEYKLAEKYLLMLKDTLFYKKWAEQNLELIRNPREVENHPLYGRLRKSMVDENYLFSEGELDKTLGQLFIKNPENNLAKQYLILYPLLQRDLNKFMQYMGFVTETQPDYNPLLAQQALAFISMKNRQPLPTGVVPPTVENSLRDFAMAWTNRNSSNIEPYRRTLYYYLVSEE